LIKTLQNTLKQDKEGFDLPKSVQDAIPIRRLWPDGIFQFGSKFSKTIRFTDINYAIASKEDKTSMFLGYSELLNALDTGSTTKITINNKRLNRQNFEQEILIPRQDDYLDGYRAEYNSMLMDKVTDSSNSVVQERYVTLSAHRKNVEEARAFFDRVTADVTTRLSHLDAHSEELDAVERLRVLHDFYRTGEEAEYRLDLHDLMRKGHSFKDSICPDSLEFKKDHFVMGGKFGRVLFLKEYASYIKDSMISELTALNRTMMLSIDVIPVPTDEAVREMQNRLLGVETNVTNWQRRQNNNNNFSAVVPYDLEQQRKETREMLDDLTTRDQRMMFAVVTLVHLADSKEELDSDTETLQSAARKHLCQLATLNWQQADGLTTALPLGLRRIDTLRTLTTEALAVLMPFKAQEIRDQGGIYYGQNVISKNLIVANRKELLNGNGFVLGVSGSGKSFTAKEEIAGVALSTEDDIIVIDPESEYGPLIEGLGGEVVNISATSRNHINAMDMEQGYGDGENPVVLKSEFLLSLCEQLVGSGKLSAKEKSIIDRCTAGVYHDYIRSGYRGAAPTLKDFHAELLRQTEAEARDVALAIELFTEGSLNTFAKPSNVDTNSRILCYDIRDLGKQLLPVGMLVVLDSIFNRVIRNRQLGKNTWVYVDEIYLLFQHEYSANFLFTLWKRVRKYGACCTGITQNLDDLLQSHTARTMLANSEFLVMLNQAATDRAELAQLLNISDNQLSYITNVDSGRGLIKCGSTIVPFMNTFPKNTRLYKLMSTKFMEQIDAT
jgi:type IV secretory pathway VirB4 component